MTTVQRSGHRPARGTRSAPSLHASQDEATDRLYWVLMRLDPERTVPWGEVERRAIAHVPGETAPWRLLEGAELELVLQQLRSRVA